MPAASLFLVLFDWKDAYWFLALLLLVLVSPAGFLPIGSRPQDMGLEPLEASGDGSGSTRAAKSDKLKLLGRDATFREALRTPLFGRLTMGYFV